MEFFLGYLYSDCNNAYYNRNDSLYIQDIKGRIDMDEEWDYTYIIDCIHKQSLVNQGYEYCDLNLDLLFCDTCPMKQSKEVKCHISATSTKEE